MRAIFARDIKNIEINDNFDYSGEEIHHLKNVVRLKKDEEVLILDGEGCILRGVCTFLGKKDLNSGSTVPEELNEIIIGDLFSQLNKPCLAIIEGDVYAGGFLLFSMCTHVFANEIVQFTLSEVHRGIWPFQVMAALLRYLPDKFVLPPEFMLVTVPIVAPAPGIPPNIAEIRFPKP